MFPYKLNLLSSFAYLRNQNLLNESLCHLSPFINGTVDSGAFSAYASKSIKDIDLDEYIESCEKHYEPAGLKYIALDKIGVQSVSWSNLDKMYKHGLKPIPVFLSNDPYEKLHEYKERSRWICIADPDELRIKAAWRYMGDPNMAIHALAYSRYPGSKQVPIVQCDSSSWNAGMVYGSLVHFDRNIGLRVFKRSDLFLKKTPREVKGLWFERVKNLLNVPMEIMSDPEHYRGVGSISGIYTATNYLLLQEELCKDNIYFCLSYANVNALSLILNIIKHWGRLDYRKIRADYELMYEKTKSDKDGFLEMCVDIVKKHTNYTEKREYIVKNDMMDKG